jgi:hypothetical protein
MRSRLSTPLMALLVAALVFAWAAVPALAAPKVTAISPNEGPAVGGTSVAISGEGFAAGATVSFGTAAATSMTINSATSITATSPAGSGTVQVKVTDSSGTSPTVAAAEFTYQWLGLNGNSGGGYWGGRNLTDFTTHNVVYDRSAPVEITAGELPSSDPEEANPWANLWRSIESGMTPIVPVEHETYTGQCSSSLPESAYLPTGAAIGAYVSGFVTSAKAIREMYPGKTILFEPINEPYCAHKVEYSNPEQYAAIIAQLLPAAQNAGIPLDTIYVAAASRACNAVTKECSANTWIPRMYAAQPSLKTLIKGWNFHPYGPPTGTFFVEKGGIEIVPKARAAMTSGQNNIIVSEIGFCTPDVGACSYTGGYPYVPDSATAAADMNRALATASAYHQAGWLKGFLVYSRHAYGWAAQISGGEFTAEGKALAAYGDIAPPAANTSPAAAEVSKDLTAIKNKVLGINGALRVEAYNGADGAIWIRYVDAAGPHTERLGGQVTAGTSPAIVRDESEMKVWIYYRGTSTALWQWEWNGSTWTNSGIGGIGRADASPTAIRDASTGKRWVYLPNSAPTVTQAEWTGSAWSVTTMGASPRSGTNVTVVRDPASGYRWAYWVNSSGWISQSTWNGFGWANNGIVGGTAQVKSTPSAVQDPSSGNRWVYYIDTEGKLRELKWGGSAWTNGVIAEGARAETSPSAIRAGSRRWVYYVGSDGRLRWRSDAGATGVASASVRARSNPSASLSSYQQTGQTVYVRTGTYFDAQAFSHTDIDQLAVNETGGTSEPAPTEGEPQMASAPAVTTIEPHVNQAVSATTGSWQGAPSVLSYQWQRCEPGGGTCSDIASAVGSTYTPVQADAGRTLVLAVTAQNTDGGATAVSGRSNVVTSAAVQNLGSFGSEGWENGKFIKPVDAAVNASGNVWIVDREKEYLQLFNPSGAYLGRLGEAGDPEAGLLPGQFELPTTVAIDSGGNIWVGDRSGRIQKFNSSGQVLLTFGKKGPGNGELGSWGAKGIAIDSSGNIWVSDYSPYIQKFSPTGQFLQKVGSEGYGPGQFHVISGIDIGPDGRIWVSDSYRDLISVFSPAGEFLYRWGNSGTGVGQISQPEGLEVDAQGAVWVEEEATSRIQEFNQYGEFMAKFGSKGTGSGQFEITWPFSLTSDSSGNLWIPDKENHRVQRWKFTP